MAADGVDPDGRCEEAAPELVAHRLEVTCLRGDPPCPAVTHFGHGIRTWPLPSLFRASSGYNLLMRGPSNWPKDGTGPSEGVIETDRTAAAATMDWKLTRPGSTVRFDVGDPLAMSVPTRRGELPNRSDAQRPGSGRSTPCTGAARADPSFPSTSASG